MRLSLWLLSCFVCLLSPPSARAGTKTKIAVLDIQTTGIDAQYVGLLTEVLTAEVDGLGRFDVVAGRDIDAMLGFESKRDAFSCTDTGCLAELGGALGVDLILVGHIGKLGDTYVVNIKLIDIRNTKTRGRIYETVKGKIDVLISIIKRSVLKLFANVESLGQATPTAVPRQERSAAATPTGDAGHLTASTSPPERFASVGMLPIVLWGVGAVSLGVGLGFGVKAKRHFVDATDPNFFGAQREIGPGRTGQLVANIGFGLGLASAIAGTAAWLLADDTDQPSAVAVAPLVGESNGVAVVGRFSSLGGL